MLLSNDALPALPKGTVLLAKNKTTFKWWYKITVNKISDAINNNVMIESSSSVIVQCETVDQDEYLNKDIGGCVFYTIDFSFERYSQTIDDILLGIVTTGSYDREQILPYLTSTK